MFIKTTHDVKITVVPEYLEDQSEPDEELYVWSYTVTMENNSDKPLRLLNRYWHVTDKMGREQKVRGKGVVGEQPMLNPGDSFQYTSGTHLSTSSGFMIGEYEMVGENGERVDVAIPAFSLDSPYQRERAN